MQSQTFGGEISCHRHFNGTDSLFNTDSVPEKISYKFFKRIYLYKIPAVITETLIV
jgi:hypothetical protein